MKSYFSALIDRLQLVSSSQQEAIKRAGEQVARSLAEGGTWFLFGTGHSHMLAEEAFYRAGGLVSVSPILESALMLHESAIQSSQMERLPNLARLILQERKLTRADVLLIASNSGRNAVPVEMALAAKESGVFTIGVTSMDHTTRVASRAPGGQRLFEVVDVVIDNGAPYGDAAIPLADGVQMGPVSTVTGAAIVNAIAIEAARALQEGGYPVHTWKSANIDETQVNDDPDYVEAVQRAHRRVRHL